MAQGLKVIIDCVPNHVARSYRSVVKPELSFGAQDDRTRSSRPSNNFFYLQGQPPLRLPTVKDGKPVSPTCQVVGGCDGLFDGERDHGKVTGNNVVSWTPNSGDWYETVKLNYGFDFTQGPARRRRNTRPRPQPGQADPRHLAEDGRRARALAGAGRGWVPLRHGALGADGVLALGHRPRPGAQARRRCSSPKPTTTTRTSSPTATC